MSATFKNAKKKLSQSELRKFMNSHREKAQITKKIESPLAKYNETGQLTCILCQTTVKSESVWPVHINSKLHHQNIEAAKRLKEKTQNFTTAKRPASVDNQEEEIPSKKIKGILKNSQNGTNTQNTEVDIKHTEIKSLDVQTMKRPGNASTDEPMEVEESSDPLPEGFFDDPKLDAKARNKEFKDPIEEEWEKFQKEIKDADNQSAAIIAEDQEEATNERQIDEIEEQMKNWSRVVHLEKKKSEVFHSSANVRIDQMEESSTSENEDVDEFLDWRCKRAYNKKST